MSVLLTLNNVNKTFIKDGEEFHAVSDVNLSVNTGEFLTFLGPSGCGKTTTLRMVAGFEMPTTGSILMGDRDITYMPANERNIGFVFQNYALFPHMKIFDNVAYGLRVRGESKTDIARKVREGLALVGLEKAEERYPNQLSGGEQQRVALARVLVLRPSLLLMDEPLSNLDAKLRIHMRSEIRRIQQELSLTCLYVTHDQKEALTMSDRIMVMNRGRIEQVGTPMEIYADPASAFVADFIGQANLIPGTLVAEEGDIGVFESHGVRVKARLGRQTPPAVGKEALLIVRPENLSFAESDNALPIVVEHCLFEGDRLDYQARLAAEGAADKLEMSVPFLPGTQIHADGTNIKASFQPHGAVIIAK
ncbi:MAG: ABC transporter ATP-binding protein [Pyramidobacter sp.]|nr:ABC transporter ATP-binding protein [Pyramidobacter sp.]